jgi:hypothetical protein
MTDRARRITLAEQRDLEGGGRQLPANYVPAAPQRRDPLPVQSPANGALGELVAGLMTEARTVHVADPVSRGKAMLLKTLAAGSFLAVATIAGMVMLDMWAFFAWMFLASLEFVGCFLYLSYNDWREHPSAIRWQWSNRLLDMMEAEQERRLDAQYGSEANPPTVKQGDVITKIIWLIVALVGMALVLFVLMGGLV